LLVITTPFQRSAESAPIDVRVRRALEFIEGRLCSELLTAGAVSEAQKLSRRHLDDLFLKSVGLRVERWIWERRLSRAEQALRAPHFGSRSLLQLALDLGFKSPSHFSRAFANRFGVAPREYRRRCQTSTGAADRQAKGDELLTASLPAWG
jgi:AraC-like DNA-binding protein